MKKSQSQIITVILLILLVIAAIIIVWQVVIKTIEKPKKEISEKLDCLTKVDLEVVEGCYENEGIFWKIRIIVKNKGKVDYNSEDFIFKITYNPRNSEETPLEPGISLKTLEQKEFSTLPISDPSDAEEFLFIPVIKQEDKNLICYEQAIDFNVEECSE